MKKVFSLVLCVVMMVTMGIGAVSAYAWSAPDFDSDVFVQISAPPFEGVRAPAHHEVMTHEGLGHSIGVFFSLFFSFVSQEFSVDYPSAFVVEAPRNNWQVLVSKSGFTCTAGEPALPGTTLRLDLVNEAFFWMGFDDDATQPIVSGAVLASDATQGGARIVRSTGPNSRGQLLQNFMSHLYVPAGAAQEGQFMATLTWSYGPYVMA